VHVNLALIIPQSSLEERYHNDGLRTRTPPI
jgi:hypothetical protein